ncbi:MAG TPA: hypothetical protein VK211_10660 [Kamptonema sp.]|nr:hypothetical protein [Kamptonema sp.]
MGIPGKHKSKEEGRRKKEEGRRKREEGRRKREEGRGKREEGRGKKEEGRGKREEGRGKKGYAERFIIIRVLRLVNWICIDFQELSHVLIN